MQWAALFLIVGLGLAGCQADGTPALPNVATPSGKPEATIQGAPAAVVRTALLNYLLSHGWSVTADSESMLQVEKPADSLLAAMLFGSKMNVTPNARIIFTFLQLGPDTRVVADVLMVTNPGTGFEQRTPLNQGNDAKTVNQYLQHDLVTEVRTLQKPQVASVH